MLTLVVDGAGAMGYCFYRGKPFLACPNIVVITPIGFQITPLSGVFLSTVISILRPLFSYGRKLSADRAKNISIRLPSDDDGKTPSMAAMRAMMRSMPFSAMFADKGNAAEDQGAV